MIRLLLIPICLALVLFQGCSKPQPATTQTSATLPIAPVTITLANSPTLKTLPEEIFPDFQLTDREVVPAPLIFARSRNESAGSYNPVILREIDDQWKLAILPSLDHTEWVYAGASIERNELWAILDSAYDARGQALYFLKSTDGGATWSLFSAIKPPAAASEFVSFTLDVKGHGSVAIHQDDDTPAVPRGLYLYQTADAAKTWTGPTFTADDMLSADPSLNLTLAETIKQIDPNSPLPSEHRSLRPLHSPTGVR